MYTLGTRFYAGVETGMRLSEICEVVLPLARFSPGTASPYRQKWNQLIQEAGDLEVHDLTPQVVYRWLKGTRNPYTYNTCVASVRSILRVAKELGLIDEIPVTPQFARCPPSPPKVFTEEELRRILSTPVVVKGKFARYRAARDTLAIRLLAFTGMRVGELVCLKHADISCDPPSIFIAKSKNGASRTVPFPCEIVPLLEHFTRVKAREGFPQDSCWLFPSHADPYAPVSYDAIRRAVDTHLARCGLEGTCHSFRHTYATMLLRKGVDIRRIQMLLGHADAHTTMMIYLHPTEEDLRAAASVLSYQDLVVIGAT